MFGLIWVRGLSVLPWWMNVQMSGDHFLLLFTTFSSLIFESSFCDNLTGDGSLTVIWQHWIHQSQTISYSFKHTKSSVLKVKIKSWIVVKYVLIWSGLCITLLKMTCIKHFPSVILLVILTCRDKWNCIIPDIDKFFFHKFN